VLNFCSTSMQRSFLCIGIFVADPVCMVIFLRLLAIVVNWFPASSRRVQGWKADDLQNTTDNANSVRDIFCTNEVLQVVSVLAC
jgi:hypothetical protein